MGIDNSADLLFHHSVQFKTIELYRCRFEQADEESVKRNVSYKFKIVQFHMNTSHTRLREVSSIIKTKNPSLLT